MKLAVEGHVDELQGRRVRGWAWCPERPGQPVTVEAWQDGVLVASSVADQQRGDLETAGKREGACAFSLLLDGVFGDVVVRTAEKDGGVELTGGRLALAPPPATLDSGTYDVLIGASVELGLHKATRWAGEAVGVGPADLIHLQELIWSLRPTAIVTTTLNVPLLRFVDSICGLAQLGGTPIFLPCEQAPEGLPGRVNVLHGSPWASEMPRQLELRVGDAEQVLVLFEAPDAPGAPTEELRRYAGLVSYRSYIVYLNTGLGQPWIGYSDRWPKDAIRKLTTGSARYAVDTRFDEQLGSTSPQGFIQRVGGLAELAKDDLALDDLDVF